MPRPSTSQQRAQRNMRILLIIISITVILAMIVQLLPPR